MATVTIKRKYDKTIPCTECFLHGKIGKYITLCAESDCISNGYVFIKVEESEVKNG